MGVDLRGGQHCTLWARDAGDYEDTDRLGDFAALPAALARRMFQSVSGHCNEADPSHTAHGTCQIEQQPPPAPESTAYKAQATTTSPMTTRPGAPPRRRVWSTSGVVMQLAPSVALVLLLGGCMDRLMEAPYVLATGLGEVNGLVPSTRGTLLAATPSGTWEVDETGARTLLSPVPSQSVAIHRGRIYALSGERILWGTSPAPAGGPPPHGGVAGARRRGHAGLVRRPGAHRHPR